jgi:hypothetical protein
MSKKIRIKACELAAMVLAGCPEDKPMPLLWSLAVFFESYIRGGAEATEKEFGPKDATVLNLAGLNSSNQRQPPGDAA